MPEDNTEGSSLTPSASSDPPDRDARSATLLAIRNGLTLGGALMMTWSIALGMRIVLPRHLGPTLFGTLNFAEAFTGTAFVLLGLGMDQYIRKEVAVRPEIASDFYGGSVFARVLMTAGLVGILALILTWTGRSPEVRLVVYIYAATQFMITANATLSALLHAKGRVSGMSALSVATKIVWAGGALWAMVAHAGLWAYATAYLASESIEVVVLTWLARQHLGLVFRIDTRATRAMLASSVPYFINNTAVSAYNRLDVSILEFSGGTKEVGLYGAATAVAGLTMLLSPLIGWVVTPMLARAAARSHEELYFHVGRSLDLILTVAVPAALMINLGADFGIKTLFGAQFAGAVAALRVLSTMFVLTYVTIIYAITLTMVDRAWTLARISVLGLAVNAGLNLLFVRHSIRLFGEGGGGTGCAFAMFCTEVFVTACMVLAIGRGAFHAGAARTFIKGLAACVLVMVAHFLLRPLGPARLLVDGLLYLVLAVAAGALRPREMLATVREAVGRGGPGEGAGAPQASRGLAGGG